jgi:GTP pyrophosphokinase
MSVHRANCSMINDFDPERMIDVQWNVTEKHTYPVHVRVTCRDKKGLLAELSTAISSHDVNISHATVETIPGEQAICEFDLEVTDLKHFNSLVTALKRLKAVQAVERVRVSDSKPEKKPEKKTDRKGMH